MRPARTDAIIGELSGGNQQKVVMARWFRCSPRVLVLDEPTQGVDVGSKADIHRLVDLATAQGTATVVCSSDNAELERLCSRVIVLQRGVVIAELRGDEITSERIEELQLVPAGSRGRRDRRSRTPRRAGRSGRSGRVTTTVVTTRAGRAAAPPSDAPGTRQGERALPVGVDLRDLRSVDPGDVPHPHHVQGRARRPGRHRHPRPRRPRAADRGDVRPVLRRDARVLARDRQLVPGQHRSHRGCSRRSSRLPRAPVSASCPG